jgi:hypothetical protein
LGRNHAGRRRHRLVRAERARLGLANTDASEPHATSALADERLIVQWRRSQNDRASQDDERRRTEDHREALDRASQDDGEAHHGQAEHREALYREALYREARHGKARHGETKDSDAPPHRRSLDREAHDALVHAQEAPLGLAGL